MRATLIKSGIAGGEGGGRCVSVGQGWAPAAPVGPAGDVWLRAAGTAAPPPRRRGPPDTPVPGEQEENLLPRDHFVKCLLPVVTLPLYLLVFIF